MDTLQRHAILLVMAVCISSILQGQNTHNREVIKHLYDVLQNNKAGSDTAVLIPGITWEDVKQPGEAEERSSIRFGAIMKNLWGSILFKDLDFQDTGKNRVLVTGVVYGRQPTECEFISTRFKHSWDLKDGKIVRFKE